MHFLKKIIVFSESKIGSEGEISMTSHMTGSRVFGSILDSSATSSKGSMNVSQICGSAELLSLAMGCMQQGFIVLVQTEFGSVVI